jgi:hypothetical protein
MVWRGRETRTEYDRAPALLGNTVVCSEKDLGVRGVPAFSELFKNLVEDNASPQRQDAWDVFDEKGLGLELVYKPDIVFEETIARVFKEATGRIDGEALARGPPDDYVELTWLQVQFLTK